MREKILEDIKIAMRAKDQTRVSVLRLLSAALKNKEIEKRGKSGEKVLTDEEVLATIRSEVKKRKDSITEFTKGGRNDLAEKEKSELGILEGYLPPDLSEKEITDAILSVTQKMGVVSEKDFGRIMGEVMRLVNGRSSGDKISATVRKIINRPVP